jgi:hypothetical protein
VQILLFPTIFIIICSNGEPPYTVRTDSFIMLKTKFTDTKKSLSITDRDFHLRYKKVLGLRTSALLMSSLVVLRYS